MEDKAIKEGFENLSPSADYDDLYEAALCRERADWLVVSMLQDSFLQFTVRL